jgi:RNA polymerase sigma factor (TIGR02999 family)
VHEAYIRLVDVDKAARWNSRGHFFAAAAEAMRRILVENARRKAGLKHGGYRRRIELEEAASYAQEPADELLALNEALDKLAQEDPVKAELVKLRYFTGRRT